MNILIVSSYLPFPLFSGGHVRLFNIIRELSEKHTITLVCEKRTHQTQEDIQILKKYCKTVIVFPRKKQWSVKNIIKTGFSQEPFLITGHTNKAMKQAIKELLAEEVFDVIHAETFYVMQNIPERTIPIVLTEHNIEYLVYKRFAQQAPRLLRPLLYIDIEKLKKRETFYWQKASVLVAVSEEEKKEMNRQDVVVVPNGVDLERFRMQDSGFKNKETERKVLFIGDFKWIQNQDAIAWILKEIWPAVQGKASLWIVGRTIPESIRKLTNDPSVIFDENAPTETAAIFKQADILLAPIRVGGGTSFKILEAMASGVPVITTSLGIEGITAKNNQEVIIAETTHDFVGGITTLFDNETTYTTIAKNARTLIEKKYSWKTIITSLEKAYQLAIKE